MKKLLLISLAAVLALSVGLIGCGGPVTYNLTISSTAGGSTTPGDGTYSYSKGEVVDLAVSPDEYYHFVNWTGDVGTIDDVNDATTIIMNGDYSITANFELEPWDDVIELDFHCTMSPPAPVVTEVYAPWAAEVEDATGPDGGKFKFNFTYGDTPYNEEGSLTALSAGVADLGQLSGDTFHLGSMSYLPFFFPDTASCAYATYNLLATEVEDWDALGELEDVKVLLASPQGPTQWWGNVPVTTLADLAGVKVRAEAAKAPTIAALGATPVTGIEVGDMAGNLLAGFVDGCFQTYSAGLFVFGLLNVTQYNTEVNLFPLLFFVLAMNRAVYEGLHPDARALLDTFCGAEISAEYALAHDAFQAECKGTINDYRASHGQPPIYVLSEEELDNWKDACASVHTDWIADMTSLGFDGQGLYDRAEELIAEYEAS